MCPAIDRLDQIRRSLPLRLFRIGIAEADMVQPGNDPCPVTPCILLALQDQSHRPVTGQYFNPQV